MRFAVPVQGARAGAGCVALALLLLAASVHAQSNDDVGWAPPMDTPASEREQPGEPDEAIDSHNDAVGWGAADDNDAVGWGSESADDSDDDAVGWGEGDDTGTDLPALADSGPSPLQINARLRSDGGLWAERLSAHPFAQGRTALELSLRYRWDPSDALQVRAVAGVHGEYDLAMRANTTPIPAPVREVYEWQVWPTETYLSLASASAELKSGFLALPLGQGEVLGTLDLLNPRDLRVPGLAALDALRLPILASKLSWSSAPHRFEAIAVHEARYSLLAPPLGDMSPMRRLLLEAPRSGEQLAEHEWRFVHRPRGLEPDRWQAVVRYTYSDQGLDLELQAGSVLDALGVARMPDPGAFDDPEIALSLSHPRYQFGAVSGAYAVGDVLLRWEAGLEYERPQTLRYNDSLRFAVDRRSQVNGLIGLTYFGFQTINFGVELSKSQLLYDREADRDAGVRLLWPVELPSVALRWTQDLFDPALQLQVIALAFGIAPVASALLRVGLDYSLSGGLVVGLLYGHYEASDRFSSFYGFERNDRAQLSVTWTFGL